MLSPEVRTHINSLKQFMFWNDFIQYSFKHIELNEKSISQHPNFP